MLTACGKQTTETESVLTVGGDVCDRETKNRFIFTNILTAISISAILAVGNLVVDLRDSVIKTEALHKSIPEMSKSWAKFENMYKLIPPGFFTQPRYGMDDARISEAAHHREVTRIDKEIARLDKEIDLAKLKDEQHKREADIWIDKINWLEQRELNGINNNPR